MLSGREEVTRERQLKAVPKSNAKGSDGYM